MKQLEGMGMYKIILNRKLPDGRRVIVYDREFYPLNYIAVVKQDGNSIPILTLSMREEEDRWKDDLSKALKVSKKELGLE